MYAFRIILYYITRILSEKKAISYPVNKRLQIPLSVILIVY